MLAGKEAQEGWGFLQMDDRVEKKQILRQQRVIGVLGSVERQVQDAMTLRNFNR